MNLLKLGTLYELLALLFTYLCISSLFGSNRNSFVMFQSYSASVESIFAVEVSTCPTIAEIKKLPNKVLLWCGKLKLIGGCL